MHSQNESFEPQTGLVVRERGYPAARKPSRDQYSEISGGPYGYEDQEGAASGGLIQYWRILRRHKWAWFAVALGTALLGFLITIPQTPSWEAQTSVEVLNENNDFMNLKQATPLTTSDGNYDTSEVQTQISLLESQTVMKSTIARLTSSYNPGSERPKSLFSRVSTSFRKVFRLRLPSPAETFANELNGIGLTLKAKPDPQTRVIQITVDSFDPKLAAAFANTLTTEFIDQNVQSRLGTTEKTSQWLSRQLDDMRKELERSEDALQSYVRSSGLIFTQTDKSSASGTPTQIPISEEKLEEVQQALSVAIADRMTKQSRYEDAQKSAPEALPDVINDQGLRETRSKLTDLRKQESDLLTLFTPSYPKVKRVEAQMKALQASFEHDRTEILNRIKDEYLEAARTEELLSAAYFAQTKVVTGDGEKSIQYGILNGNVESNRQLYETMLQQLKQSTIASAMRASTVRVVDTADVPLKPYSPKPLLSTAVGLLAGIFLGAVFIIMREQADRTIQQPGDTAFYLNVPELGVIPSRHLDVKGRRGSLAPPAGVGLAQGTKTEGVQVLPSKVELITWQQKPSLVAESFRSTLISILFSNQNGPQPRVIVLSSAGPGEGKSTIASNLAIAIAEVGMKILLIDADMRKPRLHDIFDLDNKRGLSSLLRENISLNGDKSLGGLIRESEIPGLFVLTSGPGNSTATNLLYGSQMPELLKYLRKEFDTVLIDTPPMLQIADARILGRIADKVILVVRAGQTSRDAAVAALQRFEEDGTKVMGTILNDWNPKTSPGGYYNYRGYKPYHYYQATTKG